MSQPTDQPVGSRRWPRRLAITFLSLTATGTVLLFAFWCWLMYATVPVLATDADGKPVSGVVICGIDNAEFQSGAGGSGRSPLFFQWVAGEPIQRKANGAKQGRGWRINFFAWLHQLTQPYGVALVWDPKRPVYTSGAGTVRVPAGWSHLTALSLGNLKHRPNDVFVVDTTPGRRGFGSPARIVLWRTSDGPAGIAQTVTWNFVETPLRDLFQAVEDTIGSPVVVDRIGLEDEGVLLDTPVTIRVTDVPVLSALRLILNSTNLTCVTRADSLFVTSVAQGSNALEMRLYAVSDLISVDGETAGASTVELDDLIVQTIYPNTWDCVGGPAELVLFKPERILWVNQLEGFHAGIDRLLAALRNKTKRLESSKEAFIRNELATRVVNVDLREAPLSDVIDELQAQVGTRYIVIDKRGLEEEGVNTDTPVSLRVSDVQLATALEDLLGQFNLATIIQDDVLVVTSKLSDHPICVRLYPVADLVHDPTCAAELCTRIETQIEPRSWQRIGDYGSLYYFAPTNCLVVMQTEAVQDEVKKLLGKTVRDRHNLDR